MNTPSLPITHKTASGTTRSKVSTFARCRCCWENFCRLFLLKVWFQGGVGLVAVGWWLWQRDLHATLGAVVVLLVLSLWSMSRERIRRNLTGDRAESGLAGRADDDWSSLGRPLLCLDEINLRRKSQEKKDRMAFRIGILYTVLAGVIVALGFQK